MPDESLYAEEVALTDIKLTLAASTHWSAEHQVHVLRLMDETGTTRNYAFEPAPFEHLRTMIEQSIIAARPE